MVDVIGDVDPVQALQLEDCSAVAVVLRQALAVIKEFGLKLSPPIELHDQHGRRWFSTYITASMHIMLEHATEALLASPTCSLARLFCPGSPAITVFLRSSLPPSQFLACAALL